MSTLDKVRRILSIGESTDEHRSLGYETARRLHGGMGGMNYADTMAAVKKVRLRTKNPAEIEAFHAGAEHYCSKNCHKESLGEQKITNKEKAEWHDAEVKHLETRSAAQVAKWYGPNVKPAHAQEAHRRNIALHREKAERHRKLFAELGESAEESPEYHSSEYHHRACLAIDHANAGRIRWAGIHQKAAENHAAAYHALTGKKIVDPLYTGSSKYISQLSSEAVAPKAKNARIQAWHWMGAKKAMGAKYGFDHNVPVNQIPTSMEHNGKTVNPRRAVIWVAQQFANKDKAKKSVKEGVVSETLRMYKPKRVNRSPEELYHHHMGKHYEHWDEAQYQDSISAEWHDDARKGARAKARADYHFGKAEHHAAKAEDYAADHFLKTGKKIKDQGYTGNSPHIED